MRHDKSITWRERYSFKYLPIFFLKNLKIRNLTWTRGIPCGSAGRESSCNEGNLGSIPRLGRSLGEGKGYLLQYSLHMDITRWSILKSDWLYSLQPKMEKLYTVSKNKTRSWLWLRSWTPCCQIQTEIEESRENHKIFHVWPKSNPLQLYSGSDK